MRDPERLLRRPSSPLAGQLLAAGADERPSAASLRRTLEVAAVSSALGVSLHGATAAAATLGAESGLAAVAGGASVAGTAATAVAGAGAPVGVAAALGTGVAAGKAAATVTALAVAKWVGVGALGGVLAASAAYRFVPGGLERSSSAPAPAASVAALARQGQRLPVTRRPLGAPQPLTANARPPSSSTTVAAALTPPAVTAFSPSSSPLATPGTPAAMSGTTAVLRIPYERAAAALPEPVLAAEVAFVDRGRAALQRGDGAGTLSALAGYEAAFPKRQLLPEVLFLRMEGWSRVGDAVQARALAQQIVARGASGPQATRAREILGR